MYSSIYSGLPQFGSIISTQLNGTPTLYSPPSANFTSPNNFDYLVLEATCQAAQNISDLLYIQKIKIIETAPISFTLPASTTFGCGTSTPQTFIVTNVYGTTGFANYTWNLGSASNNWLYNGSPATQTSSTGTTGSISLTPVCGTVQTNVYATVTANGNTYNTNTSTVSITQPSLSINGSNAFCSGFANYSVTGFPCNASVVWSITPATGVANLSCSTCTSTSLSYVGNSAVTLTATVSNVCAKQIIINKSIAVGTSTSTCSDIGGNTGSCIQTNLVCPSQLNYWQYAYIPGTWGASGTGYHLEVHGGGYFSNGLTTQDITSNYFSVWVPSGGNNITVSGMNGCGVSPYTPYVIVYFPKNYGCGSFYTVSPNPAKSAITVSPNASGTSGINKTQEEKLIDRVSIYSEQGTLLKDRKISKMQTTTLNISALIPGKYFIEVTSGAYKERQIIIVQ